MFLWAVAARCVSADSLARSGDLDFVGPFEADEARMVTADSAEPSPMIPASASAQSSKAARFSASVAFLQNRKVADIRLQQAGRTFGGSREHTNPITEEETQ